MNKPTLIYHADWGSKDSKRWCAKAFLRADGRYAVVEPTRVGNATHRPPETRSSENAPRPLSSPSVSELVIMSRMRPLYLATTGGALIARIEPAIIILLSKITGMRLWMGAITSLGTEVKTGKVSSGAMSLGHQPSHRPAKTYVEVSPALRS